MHIDLIVVFILLILGYGFGRYAERRHYQSIIRREKDMRGMLTFSSKTPPQELRISNATLVGGNVVISVDYFKRFVSGLRGLIGGRMKTYETLLDRARREAILRMKSEAQEQGAGMIFNIKMETASISKGAKDTIGSVEVYAYGTAVTLS